MSSEEQARPEVAEPERRRAAPATTSAPVVIVAARNEADRIGATLVTLAGALPGSEIVVADDASTDATAEVAGAHGVRVVTGDRARGKGANVSAAIETVIHRTAEPAPPTFLLCDGDLGDSAGELAVLIDVVDSGDADLAIATFTNRVGGGFGVALGFARWAIERRCGYRAATPISGQRAMTADVLRRVYPFASGYGMEIGITVDAVRGGYSVHEVELELAHRATGRTLGGFLHRARQLRDFVRVWWARR